MSVAGCFKAARGVEAGSEFMGERLVMDKVVFSSRLNRGFVKTFSIQLSPFDSGDLCRD